jgi:hypothetical protein
MLIGGPPVTDDIPRGSSPPWSGGRSPATRSGATKTQMSCSPRLRWRARQASGSRRQRRPGVSGSAARVQSQPLARPRRGGRDPPGDSGRRRCRQRARGPPDGRAACNRVDNRLRGPRDSPPDPAHRDRSDSSVDADVLRDRPPVTEPCPPRPDLRPVSSNLVHERRWQNLCNGRRSVARFTEPAPDHKLTRQGFMRFLKRDQERAAKVGTGRADSDGFIIGDALELTSVRRVQIP